MNLSILQFFLQHNIHYNTDNVYYSTGHNFIKINIILILLYIMLKNSQIYSKNLTCEQR